MKRDEQKRRYPSCCTAYYCGETDCPEDCPWLPRLREFKEWVASTGAVETDPIWSPNYFEVPSCTSE